MENFFGTYIRDIGHLCTPTQMSYAVVNRYGVSDYSPVNIECLGMCLHTLYVTCLCNIYKQFAYIHREVPHIEAQLCQRS